MVTVMQLQGSCYTPNTVNPLILGTRGFHFWCFKASSHNLSLSWDWGTVSIMMGQTVMVWFNSGGGQDLLLRVTLCFIVLSVCGGCWWEITRPERTVAWRQGSALHTSLYYRTLKLREIKHVKDQHRKQIKIKMLWLNSRGEWSEFELLCVKQTELVQMLATIFLLWGLGQVTLPPWLSADAFIMGQNCTSSFWKHM